MMGPWAALLVFRIAQTREKFLFVTRSHEFLNHLRSTNHRGELATSAGGAASQAKSQPAFIFDNLDLFDMLDGNAKLRLQEARYEPEAWAPIRSFQDKSLAKVKLKPLIGSGKSLFGYGVRLPYIMVDE
jgi:hypothetical protein